MSRIYDLNKDFYGAVAVDRETGGYIGGRNVIDAWPSSFDIDVLVQEATNGITDIKITPVSVARTANPTPADPVDITGLTVRYIKPVATGTGDGTSWANAGDLSNLSAFATEAGDTGYVFLSADDGVYTRDDLVWDAQAVVMGVDVNLRPKLFIHDGESRFPWVRSSDPEKVTTVSGQPTGDDIFKPGGNGCRLRYGIIANCQIPIFPTADRDGLELTHIYTYNTRYTLYQTSTGRVSNNLRINGGGNIGFSKDYIRGKGTYTNWIIENVYVDGSRQDKDSFMMAIFLDDDGSNITIRNCTLINSHQSREDFNYWNADLIVSEILTRLISLIDLYLAGATDGGVDLKGEGHSLTRIHIADCKRNFRLWCGRAEPIPCVDCTSEAPRSRGGIGGAAGIHIVGRSTLPTNIYPGADGEGGMSIFTGFSAVGEHPTVYLLENTNASLIVVSPDYSQLPAGYTEINVANPTSKCLIGDGIDLVASTMVTPLTGDIYPNIVYEFDLEADKEVCWKIFAGKQDTSYLRNGDKMTAGPFDAADIGNAYAVDMGRWTANAVRSDFTFTRTLAANPVAPYCVSSIKFNDADGATTATDEIGIANLTFSGTAQIRNDGPADYALSIDGFTGFVEIANKPAYDLGANEFTFTFNIKATDWTDGATQHIIGKQDNGFGGTYDSWVFRAFNSGTFQFTMFSDAGDASVSTTGLQDGQDYEIRVDRDSTGNLRLYVNGTMVDKATGITQSVRSTTNNIRIGTNFSNENTFAGEIWDYRLDNGQALTADDAGY